MGDGDSNDGQDEKTLSRATAVADAIGAEHPSVHLSRSWRRSPAAFYDTLSRSENLCALSACDVEHSALGTGEAGVPRRGDEFSSAHRSAGPRAT